MGLRRPFRTRPGRRSRRGGVRAVITWVTRFASKIGNIHTLPMRGPSTVGAPNVGMGLLQCNINYGSAARPQYPQNG